MLSFRISHLQKYRSAIQLLQKKKKIIKKNWENQPAVFLQGHMTQQSVSRENLLTYKLALIHELALFKNRIDKSLLMYTHVASMSFRFFAIVSQYRFIGPVLHFGTHTVLTI